ncbi:hypothetical protein RUM43_014708 [Polyplax serrata]|uniref:Uncharacterized protein n=1 Tax=Polyplax serrata TaxID=468196 RepID=A0AAN8NPG9_POLSC
MRGGGDCPVKGWLCGLPLQGSSTRHSQESEDLKQSRGQNEGGTKNTGQSIPQREARSPTHPKETSLHHHHFDFE